MSIEELKVSNGRCYRETVEDGQALYYLQVTLNCRSGLMSTSMNWLGPADIPVDVRVEQVSQPDGSVWEQATLYDTRDNRTLTFVTTQLVSAVPPPPPDPNRPWWQRIWDWARAPVDPYEEW